MIFISEPQDGWEAIERMFLKELVLAIYRNIICADFDIENSSEDSVFKYKKAYRDLENAFIFMAINESGYTQQEVASILDISQVAVQKRLKNTTQKIRKKGL